MRRVVARHDHFPVDTNKGIVHGSRPRSVRCFNLDMAVNDSLPSTSSGQPHRSPVNIARPVVPAHWRFFTDAGSVAHGRFHPRQSRGHARWRLSFVMLVQCFQDVVPTWGKNATLQARKHSVLCGLTVEGE